MQKVHIFGIHIDALTMQQSVQTLLVWVQHSSSICRYVVTPNVDHLVQLERNSLLKRAYDQAAMVLVDGKPVRWAANLLGENIPETVPGSDLVPAIFAAAQAQRQPLSVFLLGAMPGVAEHAKANIESQWPMVRVAGLHSPDFGFEKNAETCANICQQINQSGAQLLVIGLGAPKQELWIQQYASALQAQVAVCAGATIDFLAGDKHRAPQWMRSIGLEWLHRMMSEPKRLAKRYWVDAISFPCIVWRAWRSKV